MGLLNRVTIVWEAAIATVLAVASVLVAPLLGLDSASFLVGLIIGLVAAGTFLIVRVLEPVERGLDGLNDGTFEPNNPLRFRCEQLLADAQSGRALVKALSGSADKNAISAAQVSFAADQLKLQLDLQVQETWPCKTGKRVSRGAKRLPPRLIAFAWCTSNPVKTCV